MAAGEPSDVVPYVGVVCAAAYFGQILKLPINLFGLFVLDFESVRLCHGLREEVDVHIDLEFPRHRNAGFYCLLVIFFRDRTGSVDIQVQIGPVFGGDAAASHVVVVRVSSVGLGECVPGLRIGVHGQAG